MTVQTTRESRQEPFFLEKKIVTDSLCIFLHAGRKYVQAFIFVLSVLEIAVMDTRGKSEFCISYVGSILYSC